VSSERSLFTWVGYSSPTLSPPYGGWPEAGFWEVVVGLVIDQQRIDSFTMSGWHSGQNVSSYWVIQCVQFCLWTRYDDGRHRVRGTFKMPKEKPWNA
jgi:hypothetical protein